MSLQASGFAQLESHRDELSFLGGVENSNATLDLTAFGQGSARIGNGGFALGGEYFHQLQRFPALGIGIDWLSADLGQNESLELLPNFDSVSSLHTVQGLVMLRLIRPSGRLRPFLVAGGGFHVTSLKLNSQPLPGFVWADTKTTESRTLYDSGEGSWSATWGLGLECQLNDVIGLGFEGRISRSGHISLSPTAPGQAIGLGDVGGSFDTRAILGRASVSF
jgi:hypothetical protein